MFFLLTFVMLVPSERQTLAKTTSQLSQNCSQPLGMEDGSILDAQITASSSYQETLVGPEKELLILIAFNIEKYRV